MELIHGMNTASYCIGDILIDGDGDEYMVLAICDKIVFLSLADDFTSSGVFYTGEELKEYGYKFKGQKESLIGEEITIKRKGKSYKVKVTEELE